MSDQQRCGECKWWGYVKIKSDPDWGSCPIDPSRMKKNTMTCHIKPTRFEPKNKEVRNG